MAIFTTAATLIGSLVAPVSSAVGKWQDRKAQVSAAKHEAKLERIKAMDNDHKDEFLLGIWSAPFLCVFIPGLQPYAFEAFEFLSNLPQWYLGAWIAISLSVFGVDKIMKIKK